MRNLISRIARYELVLLAAATPLLLFPGVWTPVGVVLIAAAWVCRWVATGRMSARTAMDGPIILLLIMTGVSLIPSVNLDLSVNRMWIIVLGVALFYGMANGLHSQRHIHLMGVGLVLVGLGVALVGLVGTDWEMGALIKIPAIYDRLPGPLIRGLPGSGVIEEYDLVNPRVVAGALAILLPVALAYLVFGQGWKLKLLSALTGLVMVGVLLLTQAPQGFLGLAAGVVLIAVWWSRWFLLGLPLGLGGLVVVWRFPDIEQRVSGWLTAEATHALHYGLFTRFANASRGMGMVRDMPYTGIGLNTFPVVDGLYSFGGSHAEHAHNTLVQTAVDLGMPGLIALLALLAAFAYTVARSYRAFRNPDQRALLIGICGAITAWLGYGLLDSITLGHKPAAALWVMLGLAAATRLRLERATPKPVPFLSRFSRKRLILVVLPLFLVLALAGLTVRKTIGAFYMNLGVIEAHRALASLDSGDSVQNHLNAAEGYFRQAIHWDPSRGRAHRLLDWSLSGNIRYWPRDTVKLERWPGGIVALGSH